MNRGISLAALLGAAAAVLFALAVTLGPAGAVVAGANGRILFARCIAPSTCQSKTARTWEIVAANPDGSKEAVLAGPYTRNEWDDHFIANSSPDGRQVIFMEGVVNHQGIWEVNNDGTGLHELFEPPAGSGLDDGPAFTPDGKHIVFTRCCPEGYGYSLWMINADGTGLTDVTKEPVVNGDGPSDNLPQVSPDGKKIVFHRCFPSDQPCVLVTVNIDGSDPHVVTDPALNAQVPNWSPDSRRIVFESDSKEGPSNIWIVNADGSGATQLTFSTTGSFAPSWSPDGTKILFSRFGSTGAVDLYTMNSDGSGVTQVTRTAAAELWSLWPQWALAAPCTASETASRTQALAAYKRNMAAARRAYFRTHHNAKARAAFVKRQKTKVQALTARVNTCG